MTPEAIYKQLDTATKDVHAWAVTKRGEFVAKIVTKYGGRNNPNGVTCTAYVHVFGGPMVTARTGPGGGYDMKTDAIARACRKIALANYAPHGGPESNKTRPETLAALDFMKLKDEGHDIPGQLRALGYDVLEVL